MLHALTVILPLKQLIWLLMDEVHIHNENLYLLYLITMTHSKNGQKHLKQDFTFKCQKFVKNFWTET